MKKVRGHHGRNAPTWKTDFHTWDALEEEMSYIWDNCRTYNEDGSDMFNLAGDLEVRVILILITWPIAGSQLAYNTTGSLPRKAGCGQESGSAATADHSQAQNICPAETIHQNQVW
jgi:hypothetical protein